LRGEAMPIDWLTMTLCAAVAATPLILLWRKRELAQATFAFAIAAAVGMTVLLQAWTSTLKVRNSRFVADAVRAVGPGPYYFYGENASVPLLFNMGQIMPQLKTPAELYGAITERPDLIVIAQTKAGRSPPPVPDGLIRAAEIRTQDQLFEVYRSTTPSVRPHLMK
jgi:hypothetical protein